MSRYRDANSGIRFKYTGEGRVLRQHYTKPNGPSSPVTRQDAGSSGSTNSSPVAAHNERHRFKSLEDDETPDGSRRTML